MPDENLGEDVTTDTGADTAPTVTVTTRKAAAKKATAKKTAAKKTAADAPAKKAAAKKAPAKRTTKKAAAAEPSTPDPAPADVAPDVPAEVAVDAPAEAPGEAPAEKPAKKAAARKSAAKKAPAAKKATTTTRTRKSAATRAAEAAAAEAPAPEAVVPEAPVQTPAETPAETEVAAAPAVLFQAPDAAKATKATVTRRTRGRAAAPVRTEPTPEPTDAETTAAETPTEVVAETPDETPAEAATDAPARTRTTTTTRSRGRSRSAGGTRTAAPQEAAPEEDELEAVAASVAPTTGPADEADTARGGADASADDTDEPDDADDADESEDSDEDRSEGGGGRRRRRRGGRRRRKSGDGGSGRSEDDSEDDPEGQHASGDAERDSDQDADQGSARDGGQGRQGNRGGGNQGGNQGGGRGGQRQGGDTGPQEQGAKDDTESGEGSSRRRRRRRRSGDDGGEQGDDPDNTVTRVRKPRSAEDEITAISGSTRLEAKKQRRRDGREAGRRRAPIVSEAEFLARREAVDRTMVIRQREDLTQIGVLEDKVLVEHYVARESQTSIIGNVYIGRVQNVLPSMEAAFIDIGKGRNAVLYAGEVNWSALGHRDGQPRKIESVLSSGQPVLVQVTKDPIGHKGARLTSQISLAGRFLVYVPDGTTSGISRKLPDTERNRLKTLLKEIVPEGAGVIVRTAAEGASEDELTRDVERLKARWEDIEKKSKGSAPQLLYGEPDLTLKVVRDLFTEDFATLVIQGDDAWDTVQSYVSHVAPDLADRLQRYEPAEHNGHDLFTTYRVDEQIAKGLDRKVWLPSGGSLVIDRTEAMTVVDVNTGKFTGSGGNLEETVTKNNLEAAEEIVRQLRLRDIGGIIVVDFIDMVLESNRDLVLRRLVECLGRDRTRHQVAEVTSLGLVQMTRKRIGTGLLEAFSDNCEHCQGRGIVTHDEPVEPKRDDEGRRGGNRSGGGGNGNGGGNDGGQGGRRSRGGRGRGQDDQAEQSGGQGDGGASKPPTPPSPKDIAAMARPEPTEASEPTETDEAPVAAAPEQPVAEQPVAEQPEAEQPEAEQPEAEQTTVVTRSRRRGASRTAPTVTEPVAAEDPVVAPVEPTPAPTPEPVAPPEPDAVSEAQAAQAPATTVVTRTRRRTAARPAAAPEPTSAAEPAPQSAPDPDPAPAPEADPEPPAAPAEPTVVTRTRTRRATRPAGPPAGGTAGEAAGEQAEESSDESSAAHVPVKKKGTRKR